jgi:flavin-dependent dehydrogenase
VKAVEFSGLRLRSWDLKKSAEVKDKELRGWIVARDVLDAALMAQAATAGVEVLQGVSPTAVNLGESCAVAVLSDGREVRGRILLIADGIDSRTAPLANMRSAARVRDLPRSLHVVSSIDGREAALDVVLGGGRAAQLVTLVRAAGQLRLSFVTRDSSSPPATQLHLFLEAARMEKLLPAKLTPEPVAGLSPAGAALDMETHVGKRTLLIGDAGGFVAAFSNEGIYPALKSGWLAAETAARALKSPVVQDELATFSAVWRAELAEYLRMPNTDLSLLLPLVFNNAQMSKRVARAFLMGQKF